ncbi:MAG: site-2 protease family protein, partial [Dolichospermum sp.]
MTFWFFIVLGLLTYLLMQYSVARATRTPVWLLWLVLMTPAFISTAWSLIYGVQQTPPSALIISVSVICLLLYWVL